MDASNWIQSTHHFNILQLVFGGRLLILGCAHMGHIAPVVSAVRICSSVRAIVNESVYARSANDQGQVIDSRRIRGMPIEVDR